MCIRDSFGAYQRSYVAEKCLKVPGAAPWLAKGVLVVCCWSGAASATPQRHSLSGGARGIQSEGQQCVQRFKRALSSFLRSLPGWATAPPGCPPRKKNASGTLHVGCAFEG
eukprot:14221427-Alexandrium_andersonii.AAC.1